MDNTQSSKVSNTIFNNIQTDIASCHQLITYFNGLDINTVIIPTKYYE